MIVYFDTSAFLPLLVEEPGSTVALRLWREAHHVASSRLIVAEAAAALAQGMRMGRLTPEEHDVLQQDVARLARELHLIDVPAEIIEQAAATAITRGLRGYDAVHLATALQLAGEDLVLAAGDRALLRAARAEGLHIVDTAGTD